MKSSSSLLKNNFLSVGEYLKEARISCHLTQSEVATKLKISPQFLSNIELAKCLPPTPLLKALTKLYQIHPQILIDLMLNEERQKLLHIFNF